MRPGVAASGGKRTLFGCPRDAIDIVMFRLGPRLLASFAVGGIACTGVFVAWLAIEDWRAPHLLDVVHLLPFILLFQAIGLIFLVPIGSLIQILPVPRFLHGLIVVAVGAVIGRALMIPIDFSGHMSFLAPLPMACGAVSALVWVGLNHERVRAGC